ncbi:MAG: PHP domain-containing protein [Desulfobacteraceae bacterium]|nr:PHP domain-containing protein [Desulfobacteraceae bacterium]
MHLQNRVQFIQPDLTELNQEHTVVDLHFHSSYSDGLNRIDKIANKAIKLGIGLAITDHNDIRGAIEIDARQDVLSIPGIELTSQEGSHLLLYFYEIKELIQFFEKHIAPFRGSNVMSCLSLPMAQLIERAREFNCLVIFPHPYCAMYTGVCNLHFSQNTLHQLLNSSDGVEAINANSISRWNLKCSVLGFNLRKIMVGGSDGHALSHMGRAVTYAKCPSSRHDFLDAVRNKSNLVMGKEIPFFHKVTSNSLKFRTNLCICQEMIKKNMSYSRIALNHKSQTIKAGILRRFNQSNSAQTLRRYLGA